MPAGKLYKVPKGSVIKVEKRRKRPKRRADGVRINKRLRLSVIKDTLSRVMSYNNAYTMSAATSAQSHLQLEIGGAKRLSSSFAAFTTPSFPYAGIYHYFGSEFPSGVSTLGGNTGLYSAFKCWKETIELEFILQSTASPCSVIMYAYPSVNNLVGATGTFTYAAMTNMKGVKYLRFQSQLTSDPKKLRLTTSPYKILGIDKAAYDSTQYEVTISGSTITYPSLTTSSCFWTFGVITDDGTGASPAITGVMYARALSQIEFASPNNLSLKPPT